MNILARRQGFMFLSLIGIQCFCYYTTISKIAEPCPKMGNLLSEGQKLYIYKCQTLKTSDVLVHVSELTSIPQPLHGKLLVPFSQTHEKQEFIRYNHHKVVLVNDLHELKPFLFYKFKGLPYVDEEELDKEVENCLKMHFNPKNCPIPLILQRFNENLLSNYLNAFYVYGINVQYYDGLELFLKSECPIRLLICSNIELEQLSHRIQNLSYHNEKKDKLTILCFCNKDQYSFPKKTELVMQSCNIEVVLFQNMLEIIQRLKRDSLRSPFSIPQKSDRILFFLDEKEKEVNYLSKMAKRIEKSIRYLKVQKIANKHELIQHIKTNEHSIVVIGKQAKEMRNYIEIEEQLEEEGLEDRVIFVRRDGEFNDRLIQKIQNLTVNPNHVCQSLLEKDLIFYGTLQNFKNVLKYFPKLSFKKFIDSSHDKQTLHSFLSISTEVVMSHIRMCGCMEKWKEQIKCRIILVKTRLNTQKYERCEPSGCDREVWYTKEEELLRAFENSQEEIYGVNFNYRCKKMAYISGILSEIFTKFKQKKHMLLNDSFQTIFLFSCEYYFFDQITNYIIKHFCSKTYNNFDKPCLFQHLKFRLYQELLQLHKSIGIEEEVLHHLEKDDSSNVYELADRLIEWATRYPVFLDEINNIWELFIYRNRAEYLSDSNTLLFLLLLAYNKTNFVQYHNQTFQHLTLKIKTGLVSCDKDAQTTFSSKVKSSYVYNFSFLLCEEVRPEAIQQPGEIFIRIEGSQLNNFSLYVPIWRNDSTFLIAPLTRFQLSIKGELLRLKMSLNTQQKMLERFTEHFLENKGGLKLFKEQRQTRKLDCFLENMCNGKLETAGYILNKMMKQAPMKNADLVNAYTIFHHLKRAEINQAFDKLRKDKYYDILSTLIASCREGSSIEDAHSCMNNEPKEDCEQKDDRNRSLSIDSQTNSAKRSALELNKTNDFKCLPPRNKRNPSEIITADVSAKDKSKRYPVSVKHNKLKPEQQNIQVQKPQKEQNELKIKILPPNLEESGEQPAKQAEQQLTPTNSVKNVDKKSIKQFFNCSLSRLNSNSSHDISQCFQFDDPIVESVDTQSPLKRKLSSKREFNFKPSTFIMVQSHGSDKKKSEDSQPGTATSTGNFNFQLKKSELSSEGSEVIQECGSEQKSALMEPVVEQEIEKHSDSSSEGKQKETQNDFFKFSLGVGKGLFNIKRKNDHLPRDSIKFSSSHGFNHLHPHLINIEEESLINSTQNIFVSAASIKESHKDTHSNKEIQSAKKPHSIKEINKENAETKRPNDRKLFTFHRNEELLASRDLGKKLKTHHLVDLNEESLVFSNSNDSVPKTKRGKAPFSKKQLFSMFDEEKEKISQRSSRSSIELQEAQRVQPQELIESSLTQQ